MDINLGQRIKYFRKRANLTQLELELKCNFAQGLISRIEKNRVNPTKETIKQIAKVLNLNQRELDYLIGETALPTSDKEVQKAYEDIRYYFEQKNVLAYLVDERARFFKASLGFKKLIGLSTKGEKKIFGNTVIKILLDDSFGIKKLIAPEYYHKLLEDQIKHYYSVLSYMQDDKYFKESLEIIKTHPIASKIFSEIEDISSLRLLTRSFKKVKFKFRNHFTITLNYYREPLLKHPRFYIVEYIPTNKLLKFLSRL